MWGEMQFEGAFDEGCARVSCSERSTSTKKVTSGVTWKARATIALPANKNTAFQNMVIVTSVLGHCSDKINVVIVLKTFNFLNYVITVKKIVYFTVSAY